MKRKIMILGIFCGLVMSGCGSGTGSQETNPLTEIADAEDILEDGELDYYVKLGAYKGLELIKEIDTVTDEDVENKIQSILQSMAEEGEAEKAAIPELTEEWVQANTNYDTTEEYTASIRTQLESAAKENSETLLKSTAWDTVYQNAEFLQIPEELIEEYTQMQVESYQAYAVYAGSEYDELLESYNLTEEDLEENAKKIVENEMISKAICREEGITEDSQLYQEKLKEALKENYYDSLEEAEEDGIERKNIIRTVKYYCALEVILDNAILTEKEVDS